MKPLRWLLVKLTGGRPMQMEKYLFQDIVVHKSVFLWTDYFGRYWMAGSKWGWFRVPGYKNRNIWEELEPFEHIENKKGRQ